MISRATATVITKLTTGGLQYVVIKTILDFEGSGLPDSECPGRTDKTYKFHKNFFSSAVIFLSMLLIVLPFFIDECRKYNASRKLSGLPPAHPYGRRAYWLSLLPGILDIVAVELTMTANKALGAVTMLLLKSLRIVVAAVLTRFILYKPQKPYQWLGVAVTLLGLIPVGFASENRKKEEALLKPKNKKNDSENNDVLISLLLVLIGEILRGLRYVYEEKLIKVEKMSAEFVVYTESLIGFVVASVALWVAHMIPGKNCGSRENLYDTIAFLNNSPALYVLFVVNFFLVGIHNYATTLVTKHLTSMHNQIISQARVIVAWLPSVLLYKFANGKYGGERLDKWTALDFFGFLILATGAFVYNGDLRICIPSCYPSEKQASEKDVKSPSTSNEEGKKEIELLHL